jgi:hypothetical protein
MALSSATRKGDARLDRDVAIKVLPDAVSRDPERLARFERCARPADVDGRSGQRTADILERHARGLFDVPVPAGYTNDAHRGRVGADDCQTVDVPEMARGYDHHGRVMNAIELIGDVDEKHRLQVQVPNDVPPGQVRVIVLVPEEDEAGKVWPGGIAREWSSELSDPREFIYTLDDGRPVNAPR